ncbi:MAG: site-specific DNA-methyltransferase [Rhizobiales bacterium]|nr:site-specific DNA-methyltransferase [Hyphomicrobiales bacterium]
MIRVAKAPGSIRDSICGYLHTIGGEASLDEISRAVAAQMGATSPSSVRSYLNLNVGKAFERTGRGRYRLKANGHDVGHANSHKLDFDPIAAVGNAKLYHADCFDWLASEPPSSIHACVTDPPYGLVEYTETEQQKLRNGKGGVWRIPPSFDGHRRAPLPRFTVLDDDDRIELYAFFKKLGVLLNRVLVPGGNVVVASNPLLMHIVGSAMSEGGLELRGGIVRLVMTMRGGDRPKNAHKEFSDVSVMPRSMFEPWVVLRRPVEGRVQDNLRRHKTGGFRRPSTERPFGDVIPSRPAPKNEREIAAHPSLKPQAFLRQVVRAALPLGEGTVLDPFAGSGSTLAAANAVGYASIGIESDAKYVRIATKAIAKLGSLREVDPI